MAAQWRIQFEDLDFSEGLGTGSFGNVTKGTYSGAEVAIKCLPLDGDDILEKNLQRQMDTLIQLDHPNIVRIKGLCFGLADLPMSSRAKPLPTLLPNSGSCFVTALLYNFVII